MKNVKTICKLGILICVVFLLVSCGKNLLKEMKSQVPLYEGAKIVNTTVRDSANTVIFEIAIDAAQASEDEILAFYKDSMGKNGWEYSDEKRYPKNGSAFTLTKNDYGTLSGQTIIKNMKQTGIITLNLHFELIKS